VSGQLHAPVTLPSGKYPTVLFEQGGWLGPRFGLEAVERESSCHCHDSNHGRPARSLVIIVTTIYQLPLRAIT